MSASNGTVDQAERWKHLALALHQAMTARAYALWLDRFAVIERFDGRCQSCGGPAVLHDDGVSVQILHPDVEPANLRDHPAANGWHPETTRSGTRG